MALPDIILSTGRKVRHKQEGNGSQLAFVTETVDGAMTKLEWEEYCAKRGMKMTHDERELVIKRASAWESVAFVTDKYHGVHLARRSQGNKTVYAIDVYGVDELTAERIKLIASQQDDTSTVVDTVGSVSDVQVLVPFVGQAVDLANKIAREGGF